MVYKRAGRLLDNTAPLAITGLLTGGLAAGVGMGLERLTAPSALDIKSLQTEDTLQQLERAKHEVANRILSKAIRDHQAMKSACVMGGVLGNYPF